MQENQSCVCLGFDLFTCLWFTVDKVWFYMAKKLRYI